MRENFKNLLAVLDVNNLAAFVDSGLRIDTMRDLRFARVFVQIKLGRFQRIVGATLARARLRMSSFWIWHLIKPLYFRICDFQFAI